MAYTTINDPTAFFQTILYTGNATDDRSISGVGFQPDWLWVKERSATSGHIIVDSIRGATKFIQSHNTTAEDTNADIIQAFESDGFEIGTHGAINENTQTYVAWNWKAGTSFTNDASATSVGSVDSAGSVSTDAGFSIINVVKNNTTAHTVAHGLGAVPQMIIGKSRTGSSYRWIVYHKDIGNTHALYLNENFVKTDSVTFWNDTTPTSSVFSLGTDNSWNGTSIFYCFAEKQGYSKFGSYTGNNDDNGTFVYTGFKPAFVMVKITAGQTDNWIMQDNKINSFNGASSQRLRPNSSGAEFSSSNEIDLLSNGFKTHGADGEINGSGFSYIYMAFAENPFVTSTGIPTTAR